jgi:hypothetical protein
MQLHNYFDYLGNLYGCPFGSREPDCPVYPIAHKSFKEILEWFKNLPKEKKDEVVDHHHMCKMKRGKKKVFL